MKLPADFITVRKLRHMTHAVGVEEIALRFANPKQKEKTNLPSTKRRK